MTGGDAANETFVDAHAKATAIKEAAGVPVGLTLAMSDDQAVAGGEAALAEHRPAGRTCRYLEAAWATTSSGSRPTPATGSGPPGCSTPSRGCP